MKTSLKIIIALVLSLALASCSAQRRAERMVRRAVNLCPELVQRQAKPISIDITAPGWVDHAKVPFSGLRRGDTVYAATPHGTFAVSLSQSDSSLSVGFVAAPTQIHYRDTIRYSQVNITGESPEVRRSRNWTSFLLWVAGVGLGAVLVLVFFRFPVKNKKK